MTGNDNRRLLEQLKAKARGIPGAERRAITGGTPQEETSSGSAASTILYHPVQTLVLVDTTGSMGWLIEGVCDGLTEITTELFQSGKGEVQMAIWGVNDHLKGQDQFACITTAPYSSQLEQLLGQIRALHAHGGDDTAEAYECGHLLAARTIAQRPTGYKTCVLGFYDAVPHGVSIPGHHDNGCPFGATAEGSWRALTTAADLSVIVGCSNDPAIVAAQRSIVREGDPKQRYIPFGQAREDIPQLITALTRYTQSPAAVQEYLKGLETGKAHRIAGLLGVKQ